MENEQKENVRTYAGNMLKKYELLDDILQSIREENEFRALS